ncbi:hypothetical protein [Pseudomonas sp. RIT-PI-AD]|uniref:hypothetical protein n=1 Tax=Pseudomonas sp. RIT-PI-AD TaxID=3035294 RepID=UPI0021D911C6|nr:hypothetical protein [Pseudomonas sp. RIT-PI-AD]
MADITFHKENSLPAQLQAGAFYFILNGAYAESYLTDANGVARLVGNSAMINALIAQALQSLPTSGAPVLYAVDIAERDALNPTEAVFVIVTDATADPTVERGAAMYAWNPATSAWLKIAEYESMDLQLTWTMLQGGPASTPAQIDDAVSKAHSHPNKPVLDKLSESADGRLRFGGVPIPAEWDVANW